MDDVIIVEQFAIVDRRLTRIEQILPTLATKKDLKAFATKEDLKALATKEDLKAYATKQDLRELRDELRTHMTVLHESQRAETRLLAEQIARVIERPNRGKEGA
jgi:hypothetical protein